MRRRRRRKRSGEGLELLFFFLLTLVGRAWRDWGVGGGG